jgi:hypothetical protein
VNVISSGIFSPDSKLIAMVLDFFLSPDGRIEDEEEEKKILSKREIAKKYGNRFSKQRRSKDKKLDQKLKENKKVRCFQLNSDNFIYLFFYIYLIL